jgi:hypothetical protein
VIKLTEAINGGNHGMRSFLDDPAVCTATSKQTRATAAVYGPNLCLVSTYWLPKIARVGLPDEGLKLQSMKDQCAEDKDRECSNCG